MVGWVIVGDVAVVVGDIVVGVVVVVGGVVVGSCVDDKFGSGLTIPPIIP